MAAVHSQEPSGSLRIGEAAELLGVSTDTVRRWCDAGKLPHWRTPSGERRVRRADIQRLLVEPEVQAG